jgi:hypothetical protein
MGRLRGRDVCRARGRSRSAAGDPVGAGNPGSSERLRPARVHRTLGVCAVSLGLDAIWCSRAPVQARRRVVSMLLRGELVFVDQPAEQVEAADAIEGDHVGDWVLVARRLAERRSLRQCAVRSVLVGARAFGARTGALMTRIPSERKTSSKSRVNFLSRSRTRNRGRTSSSSSCITRLRACCVTQPPLGLVVIRQDARGGSPAR